MSQNNSQGHGPQAQKPSIPHRFPTLWETAINSSCLVLSRFLTYPFEVARTIQQNHDMLIPYQNASASSILRSRVAVQGLSGLYTGVGLYLIDNMVLLSSGVYLKGFLSLLIAKMPKEAQKIAQMLCDLTVPETAIPGVVLRPMENLVLAYMLNTPVSLRGFFAALQLRGSAPQANYVTQHFPSVTALYAGAPAKALQLALYRHVLGFVRSMAAKVFGEPKTTTASRITSTICLAISVTVVTPLDSIARHQFLLSVEGKPASFFDALSVVWSEGMLYSGASLLFGRTIAMTALAYWLHDKVG